MATRALPLVALLTLTLGQLAFPSLLPALPAPALEIRQARLVKTSEGTRVRLSARCAASAPPAALDPTRVPLELRVASVVTTGVNPQPLGRRRTRVPLTAEHAWGIALVTVTAQGSGSRLELSAELRLADLPPNPIAIRFRLGEASCTRTVRFQARRDLALRFPWRGAGDADRDGAFDDDCAQRDPGVHPGAADVCGNGLDEDCDGADAPCVPPPLFPGAQDLSTFGSPLATDLNDDGVMDLFAPDSGSLGVLLGRGDGTFLARSFPYGDDGFGIATVTTDVDGDGGLDVVSVGGRFSKLHVFRGRGGGRFAWARELWMEGEALGVLAADFDGDGRSDLATPHFGVAAHGFMGLYRSMPGGPIAYHERLRPTVHYPSGSATADFDRDGRADVVLVDTDGRVEVMLGTGDGRFVSQPILPNVTPGCRQLRKAVAADFDGDAIADVAIGGCAAVVILPGIGDGSFAPAARYAAGRLTGMLAAGDLDADGRIDLVTERFQVLHGEADGTFDVGNRLGIRMGLGSRVAIGSFDGNDQLGVIADSFFFPNRGGLDFGVRAIELPLAPAAIAAADLDGDGRDDYVVAGERWTGPGAVGVGAIAVLRGAGDATPALRQRIELDSEGFGAALPAVAIADLDGDTRADLAVADRRGSAVRVFRGAGDGSVTPAAVVDVGPFHAPTDVVAADLDGDGRRDLLAIDPGSDEYGLFFTHPPELIVALNLGGGTFGSARRFPLTAPSELVGSRRLAVADLDGDGAADVAATRRYGVAILRGRGDGSFEAPRTYALDGDSIAVEIIDVDDDGHDDLVALAERHGFVIFRGDGRGDFTLARVLPHWADGELRVVDVDGDGRRDLITAGSHGFAISRGRGGGDFSEPETFAGDLPAFAVSDANADGRLDLVGGTLPLRGPSDGADQPHGLRILLQSR